MFAGALDRRVIWETSVDTRDSTGNIVKTWSPAFTTWCCKAQLFGQALVQANEDTKEATVKLQIRWRDGLSTVDRITFEGQVWRIQAIAEIGRREGLEIMAKTRRDTAQVTG